MEQTLANNSTYHLWCLVVSWALNIGLSSTLLDLLLPSFLTHCFGLWLFVGDRCPVFQIIIFSSISPLLHHNVNTDVWKRVSTKYYIQVSQSIDHWPIRFFFFDNLFLYHWNRLHCTWAIASGFLLLLTQSFDKITTALKSQHCSRSPYCLYFFSKKIQALSPEIPQFFSNSF